MSPRRGGGCLGDAPSCPPRRPVGGSARVQPGAPQPSPAAAAAWRSRVPAAAPGTSQPPPPPGTRGEGGGRPPGKMKAEGGDHSMINLSVQQVLSLWAHGTVLRNLTEMWYWVFLWALFSSLFVHGAAGVLMFVTLQRHRQGRVISVVAVSVGFLASVTGAMITSLPASSTERAGPCGMTPSVHNRGSHTAAHEARARGAPGEVARELRLLVLSKEFPVALQHPFVFEAGAFIPSWKARP
ncbi:transmembrane protein 170B isoform X1 [Manis javanica]|uniref:transmembrane protein 170B isoform X1 n=1 Tax=Manis javanica TaxID=9974 RepID=UPI003C6CDEA3